MVTTNLSGSILDPFAGSLISSRRAMNPYQSFKIWRSVITDGRDRRFGELPSRGLGIMTSTYIEIIRQVSCGGWALASNPKARSLQAKALWGRIRGVRDIEVVRSRSSNHPFEFAFILAGRLATVDNTDTPSP
jgi:hypothetical protein